MSGFSRFFREKSNGENPMKKTIQSNPNATDSSIRPKKKNVAEKTAWMKRKSRYIGI
jgi:hypothetical protein